MRLDRNIWRCFNCRSHIGDNCKYCTLESKRLQNINACVDALNRVEDAAKEQRFSKAEDIAKIANLCRIFASKAVKSSKNKVQYEKIVYECVHRVQKLIA